MYGFFETLGAILGLSRVTQNQLRAVSRKLIPWSFPKTTRSQASRKTQVHPVEEGHAVRVVAYRDILSIS